MTDSSSFLRAFFDRSVEKQINEKMFYRDYVFPYDIVMEYLRQIIETPISAFVEYIRDNMSISYLDYADVVQFSSIRDASLGICAKLRNTSDEGLNFVEVGRLLLCNEAEKKEGAYRKYGENHTKTACEFGLVQILYSKTYMASLGMVYPDLSEEDQAKLLRRLILRNRYFSLIVKLSKDSAIALDSQMDFLSESTKIRRLSNVKKCWEILLAEAQNGTNLETMVIR